MITSTRNRTKLGFRNVLLSMRVFTSTLFAETAYKFGLVWSTYYINSRHPRAKTTAQQEYQQEYIPSTDDENRNSTKQLARRPNPRLTNLNQRKPAHHEPSTRGSQLD